MGSASTLGVSGAAAGSGSGARPELGNWLPPPSDLGPACPAPLAAGVTTKRWDMVARAPDPASWSPGAGRRQNCGAGAWPVRPRAGPRSARRGRGRGSGGGGAGAGEEPASGTQSCQGPRRGQWRRAAEGDTAGSGEGAPVQLGARLEAQSLGKGAHSLRETRKPRSPSQSVPSEQQSLGNLATRPWRGQRQGLGHSYQWMLETSLVWDSDHPQQQNGSQGPVTRRLVPEFPGVSDGGGLLDHGVWGRGTLAWHAPIPQLWLLDH